MIERLETEALERLTSDASSGARISVSMLHEGAPVEVRARRMANGASALGYSYAGVRLERAVLLLLLCPEGACARSQIVKSQWQASNPLQPVQQRTPLSTAKSTPYFEPSRLFDEVPFDSDGRHVARPAMFNCLTRCPVGAHQAIVMRKAGWDLFKDGKCIAGGLTQSQESDEQTPKFSNIVAVEAWLAQSESPQFKLGGTCGQSQHQ